MTTEETVTLRPAVIYGHGCEECRVPYQYAFIEVVQHGHAPKFICDLCARNLYDFSGRPSAWNWPIEVHHRIKKGAA